MLLKNLKKVFPVKKSFVVFLRKKVVMLSMSMFLRFGIHFKLKRWKITTDDDTRRLHANTHTHLSARLAANKVITSFYRQPVKQQLHHTNT